MISALHPLRRDILDERKQTDSVSISSVIGHFADDG
jgi:hypothetical protein